MSLMVAAVMSLFILNCVISAKKLVAVLVLVALFYVHLPVAIGLSLVLAATFYYTL